MAYSTLDSLFGTYVGDEKTRRPCVIGTGFTNGARAWPMAPRRNFVSTIAPSPLLTPYQILQQQPLRQPSPAWMTQTQPPNVQVRGFDGVDDLSNV